MHYNPQSYFYKILLNFPQIKLPKINPPHSFEIIPQVRVQSRMLTQINQILLLRFSTLLKQKPYDFKALRLIDFDCKRRLLMLV